MKKSLMKRFFVEEKGMETLQIVMICAVAGVIMFAILGAWKGGWFETLKNWIERLFKD